MTTKYVLILEDDPSIREAVAEVLALEGFHVAAAAHGREGLRLLADRQPDVILLDLQMPVMDGWAFARELQSRGLMIPTIVMTAAYRGAAWARETGAAAFVAKPFDLDELVALVKRISKFEVGSNWDFNSGSTCGNGL